MTNEEFINSIKLEGEEWKDVVGYESYYIVSSFGRVISLGRTVPIKNSTRYKQPYLLTIGKSIQGYPKVIFSMKNIHKSPNVHRLVAQAFIPNPYNKPMVDHIDRDKTNNYVSNLRWCTLVENMNNPNTVEHCRNLNKGREYPLHFIPVVAVSIKNKSVLHFDSLKQAAKILQCKSCGISNAIAKKTPTYKGYIWYYLSDYETLINKSKNPLSSTSDYPQYEPPLNP